MALTSKIISNIYFAHIKLPKEPRYLRKSLQMRALVRSNKILNVNNQRRFVQHLDLIRRMLASIIACNTIREWFLVFRLRETGHSKRRDSNRANKSSHIDVNRIVLKRTNFHEGLGNLGDFSKYILSSRNRMKQHLLRLLGRAVREETAPALLSPRSPDSL